MIREIIIPDTGEYTLRIPASFIGKEIEVLAFEVGKESTKAKKTIEELEQELTGLTVNDPDYTFDRNEANNYE